jgi:heme A synthase
LNDPLSGTESMNEKNLPLEGWRVYRKLRLTVFMMVVGWIPVMWGTNWLQVRFHLPLGVVIGVAIVWIGTAFVQGLRLVSWPCPYCGKSFCGLLPFLPQKCRSCQHSR